ncbi:MAG: hypothetical protein F4Z10_01020, partial [Synechococcus sp. SB0666_bin_14]|nr:hypothetical protein [Synechococcus sp. SB0666_bin_14]MYK90639.1 hypothetical protein [Synechococcus sp. SB0669_bin_8]
MGAPLWRRRTLPPALPTESLSVASAHPAGQATGEQLAQQPLRPARRTSGPVRESRPVSAWSAASASSAARWLRRHPLAALLFLPLLAGIAPDAAAQTVTIAPKTNTNAITEGTAAVFTVTRTGATTNALTVKLHVDDAANSDFVASSNEGDKTVSIPVGSLTADYSVPTSGDTTDEPNGDVTVTVKMDAAYMVGSPSSAVRTVNDNDATTVWLGGVLGALFEGNTTTFTLGPGRLSSGNLIAGRGLYNGETLTIPLTFSSGAGTATRGTDYTMACGSATGVVCSNLNSGNAKVVFTGPSTGATAASVTITITAVTDSTVEAGGETVNISMGTLTETGMGGGVTGRDESRKFWIGDPSDAVVRIQHRPPIGPITEGAGAVFEVYRSGPAPATPLTVNLHVDDAANSDFVLSGNEGDKTVVIPANLLSADYTIPTVDDSTDEPNGKVKLTMRSGTGYVPDTYSEDLQTRQVNDNDAGAALSVLLFGQIDPLFEGGTKTFTLSLGRGLYSGETLTIPLTFSGTATRGTDYTMVCGSATGVACSNLNSGTATVVFTGPTAASVTITITGVTDSTAEGGGETVNIGLGNLSSTGLGNGVTSGDSFGEFWIADAGTLYVSITNISPPSGPITEGADAVFEVSRSRQVPGLAPTTPLTVNLHVDDAPGSDFLDAGQEGDKTVVIPANRLKVEYTIPTVDDTTDEPNGDVKVTVRPGTDYVPAGAVRVETRTVNDNDSAPTAPVKPTGFRPTAGNTAVTLAWDNPSNSAITKYQYQQKAGSGNYGSWTDIGSSGATTVSHRVTGLTNGTVYKFRIRAVAGTLNGAQSDEVTATPAAASGRDGDSGGGGGVPAPAVDLVPTFGVASIADQTWEEGRAIREVVLPEASGGDGVLTYRLTPSLLPAGVSLDGATRRLSGTPLAPQGAMQYEWTARDADGDEAVLRFSVTVSEDPKREGIREATRRSLAELGRKAMTSALSTIGGRFSGVVGNGLSVAGQPVPLQDGSAAAVVGAEGAVSWEPTGLSAEELWGGSAFSLELAGASGAVGSGDAPAEGGSPLWAVWGRGDLATFAGQGEMEMEYDGWLRSGWLGLDACSGPWVAGLAVSREEGRADYRAVETDGRLETSLTGIYPYGRWSVSEGLEVHGVVGAGWGEARHTTGEAAEETGDLSMRLVAVGLRQVLAQGEGLSLSLRADGAITRMETAHGPSAVEGLSADSWRLRAGVEASRRIPLEEEGWLEPFLEAAVRQDGGDALSGSGMELAGGMRYGAPGVA